MIQIFSQLKDRAEVLVILLLVTLVLHIINSIDGALMSATISEFSWTRFWQSMLKCFLIGISVITLWFCIEVICASLKVIEFDIPSDLITFIEIITMIVGIDTKYIKEIFVKLQTLLGYGNDNSISG